MFRKHHNLSWSENILYSANKTFAYKMILLWKTLFHWCEHVYYSELSSAATDMEANISEMKSLSKSDKQQETEFQVNSICREKSCNDMTDKSVFHQCCMRH